MGAIASIMAVVPYLDVRSARYYYEERGEGDRTVVCAHGFLLDSGLFRYQMEEFSKEYRCVAFDWRGQGRSEAVPCGYEIEELYRDAVDLLKAFGCKEKPCVWVGVSMGGFVGMRLAARNPDLVRGVVLAETGATRERPLKKLLWSMMAVAFRVVGPSAVSGGIKKALFSPRSIDRPFVKEYEMKWMEWARDRRRREALVQTAWAIFNRPDFTRELGSIKVPTLVVVGEEDRARPYEEALQMHRAIAGSRLVVIPRAGHSSPLENPEDFNRHLREFLKEVFDEAG